MTENSKSLRPVIRDIMKAVPDRPLTIKALWRLIRSDDPSITELDVDAAMTWHYGQGNVARQFNHELECDEYKLTARGLK